MYYRLSSQRLQSYLGTAYNAPSLDELREDLIMLVELDYEEGSPEYVGLQTKTLDELLDLKGLRVEESHVPFSENEHPRKQTIATYLNTPSIDNKTFEPKEYVRQAVV